MKEATAVATITEQHKAQYTGEEALEGITFDGPIYGLFWTVNNVGLFQPNGSTKVFEVAETDIELLEQ